MVVKTLKATPATVREERMVVKTPKTTQATVREEGLTLCLLKLSMHPINLIEYSEDYFAKNCRISGEELARFGIKLLRNLITSNCCYFCLY